MRARNRIVVVLLAVLAAVFVMPHALASELTEEEQLEQAFLDLFGSIHMVVLTDDFVGDPLVADGQDYTFEGADDGYDYTIMAYMDGEPVSAIDNGNGTFTIRNVTGSLVIGGRKIEKIPETPVVAPPASSVTTSPQIPAAPETPVEPEAVPEEVAPEPEIVPEEPVREPEPVQPQKPEATDEPVVEVPEKGPFPWWILALALLVIVGITALVILLNRRTVSFAVEGGSAVRPQKVLKGRKAARPVEPEKDGAIFAGWFQDEARTQRWDFENTAVEGHMTLYAKWLAVG